MELNKKPLEIGLGQINPTVGDFKQNCFKIFSIMKKHGHQFDIIIFPELSISGYPLRDLNSIEELYIQEQKELEKIITFTKELKTSIILGHRQKSNVGLLYYNCASFISNGKVIHTHIKQKLPNYDIFEEQRFFTSKQNTKHFFTFKDNKISINICEDSWDIVSAHNSKDERKYLNTLNYENIDYLINISASPFTTTKIKKRIDLFSKIAIENNINIAYVNQTGANDEIVFDGASMLISPDGKIKHFLTYSQTITDQKHEKIKIFSNYWQDIHNNIILGIRDYFKKNGFEKAIIGLSGGIDSALILYLSSKAIGRENVTAISMPSKYTSNISLEIIRNLITKLQVKLIEKNIDPAVKAIESIDNFSKDITLQNIQSRVRGLILMSYANEQNSLVIGTGNKSELSLGYATLYGDIIGCLLPIGDLTKTKVFGLSHYINNNIENIFPNSLMQRAPSAELKNNQKDEDSLPNYELLDTILERHILKDQFLSKKDKYIKFLNNYNINYNHLVEQFFNSEFKRRQSPPIIKIDNRSFGQGWLMPITHKAGQSE